MPKIPGLTEQDNVPLLGIVLRELRHLRARADDAHVAPEHVQQLGKLVELGPLEEAADGRQPVVVAPGYAGPGAAPSSRASCGTST